MTEQQLLALQRDSGRWCLMQVGQFYHAYEGAAFALARLTGYRVRRMRRRTGSVCVLGFSILQLEKVRQRCAEQGVILRQDDDAGHLWSFTGGDGTPDEGMVSPPKSPSPAKEAPVSRSTSKGGGKRKNAGDPVRIYAAAVQLQNLSMRLLDPYTAVARKYRFTVMPELLRMATRLLELTDLMNSAFGDERMAYAMKVGSLVRTYATTVGNLVDLKAISNAREADVAVLVEAIETEAKTVWWESHNRQQGNKNHSQPESVGADAHDGVS